MRCLLQFFHSVIALVLLCYYFVITLMFHFIYFMLSNSTVFIALSTTYFQIKMVALLYVSAHTWLSHLSQHWHTCLHPTYSYSSPSTIPSGRKGGEQERYFLGEFAYLAYSLFEFQEWCQPAPNHTTKTKFPKQFLYSKLHTELSIIILPL